MSHPLDKPIWSALTSRQAHFARGGDVARAFPIDVSPFAAARDDSPAAVSALAALVPADAQEMLALATLTKPGPFHARPHTMGAFVGIRDGARLVAMASASRWTASPS